MEADNLPAPSHTPNQTGCFPASSVPYPVDPDNDANEDY